MPSRHRGTELGIVEERSLGHLGADDAGADRIDAGNRAVSSALPFADRQDFDDARRGFRNAARFAELTLFDDFDPAFAIVDPRHLR